MGEVEQTISAAIEQVKELLTSGRVVGDPIKIGDATIIPLVSIGFGFGGGGSKEESEGRGAGAGGGIKPVALVVADNDGVRVEPIKSMGSSFAASVSEIVRTVAENKDAFQKKDDSDKK